MMGIIFNGIFYCIRTDVVDVIEKRTCLEKLNDFYKIYTIIITFISYLLIDSLDHHFLLHFKGLILKFVMAFECYFFIEHFRICLWDIFKFMENISYFLLQFPLSKHYFLGLSCKAFIIRALCDNYLIQITADDAVLAGNIWRYGLVFFYIDLFWYCLTKIALFSSTCEFQMIISKITFCLFNFLKEGLFDGWEKLFGILIFFIGGEVRYFLLGIHL